MNYKKLVQMLIIVVASVWVFCIVLIISYKAAEKNKPVPAPVTTQSVTTAAQTTEPLASTAEYSVPDITIGGNNVTTAASVDTPQWVIDQEASKKAEEAAKTTTSKSSIPKSKKEIINAYVTAANKLKKKTDFTLTKTEELIVKIDNITGGDTVKNIAEQIVKSNDRNGTTTYKFSNSMDSTTGKSPNQVIAPLGAQAEISEKYVTKATASEGSNGSCKVKIELGKQTQTLNTPAPGYSTFIEVIDIDTLGLPSAMTLTDLEIIYDNSYVEATIDKDGNITSMTHYIEVAESNSSGKLTLIPASLKMHGSYTCNYKISY